MPRHRAVVTALGFACCLASACFQLDLEGKTDCVTQRDCISGYVCLNETCLPVNGSNLWRRTCSGLDQLQSVTGAGTAAVWAGVSDGDLARWDGSTWHVEAFCDGCSSSGHLWASDVDEVWALDDQGAVARHDGLSWQVVSPAGALGALNRIAGVPGRPEHGLYAVGADGKVEWFDGATWQAGASGVTEHLHGVSIHAADATPDGVRAWAVGRAGAIVARVGASQAWTREASSVDAWLLDVWAADDSRAWAVGSDGAIVARDTGGWVASESGTQRWLHAVWGSSVEDVWAGGGIGAEDTRAVVLHYDGQRWSEVPTDEPDVSVVDIWGTGPQDVWVGLSDGCTLHYEGASLVP